MRSALRSVLLCSVLNVCAPLSVVSSTVFVIRGRKAGDGILMASLTTQQVERVVAAGSVATGEYIATVQQ